MKFKIILLLVMILLLVGCHNSKVKDDNMILSEVDVSSNEILKNAISKVEKLYQNDMFIIEKSSSKAQMLEFVMLRIEGVEIMIPSDSSQMMIVKNNQYYIYDLDENTVNLYSEGNENPIKETLSKYVALLKSIKDNQTAFTVEKQQVSSEDEVVFRTVISGIDFEKVSKIFAESFGENSYSNVPLGAHIEIIESTEELIEIYMEVGTDEEEVNLISLVFGRNLDEIYDYIGFDISFILEYLP